MSTITIATVGIDANAAIIDFMMRSDVAGHGYAHAEILRLVAAGHDDASVAHMRNNKTDNYMYNHRAIMDALMTGSTVQAYAASAASLLTRMLEDVRFSPSLAVRTLLNARVRDLADIAGYMPRPAAAVGGTIHAAPLRRRVVAAPVCSECNMEIPAMETPSTHECL